MATRRPAEPTARDFDLMELALESAAQACQTFGSRKVDPLAAEYLHAAEVASVLRDGAEMQYLPQYRVHGRAQWKNLRGTMPERADAEAAADAYLRAATGAEQSRVVARTVIYTPWIEVQ